MSGKITVTKVDDFYHISTRLEINYSKCYTSTNLEFAIKELPFEIDAATNISILSFDRNELNDIPVSDYSFIVKMTCSHIVDLGDAIMFHHVQDNLSSVLEYDNDHVVELKRMVIKDGRGNELTVLPGDSTYMMISMNRG